MCEVRRASDGHIRCAIDGGKREFGGLARGDFGRLFNMLLAERFKRLENCIRQSAGHSPQEGFALRRGRKPSFPGEPLAGAPLCNVPPRGDNFVRYLEGRVIPADVLPGGGNLGIAKRSAVRLLRSAEIWRTFANHRPAGNERRPVGALGLLDGSGNRFDIMAIDFLDLPAGRCEACRLVHRRR